MSKAIAFKSCLTVVTVGVLLLAACSDNSAVRTRYHCEKMLFEADQPRPGAGGRVTLWANDKQIGEGRLDKTISLIFTTYAGMDMGRDNGGVVDLAYEEKAPYAFTGTVKKVIFDLKPARVDHLEQLHEQAAMQEVGHGAAG